MSTFGNNLQSSSKRRTYIAFSLLVSTLLIVAPVSAQDASGMGMDQDSLLPPEVVPLDPASATQAVSNQAQSRAQDMASAPGLSSPQASASNMLPQNSGGSTAQDFRKDAFNSLYNQGSLPPQSSMQPGLQGMQGQMGATPGQMGATPGQLGYGTPTPGSMPGQQSNPNLGQSPWMSANGAPQQQTLMGGANTKANNNSKFNAAKHVLGTAAGFGGAAMIGALMFSRGASSPSAALGMGLLGAGMLNYGLRSGFAGF